ncbi:MAG: biotin--[acetyl-CoA-carboxylase] ligase, partial [Clostridia bacterium]|nr:biotin--[acetyl-CoA-carboxylase] ligase [Clostridia bacterium]
TDVVDLSRKVRVYPVIDSTNEEAKRLLSTSEAEDNMLLVANEQTAGKGRQGHSFYSPADTGLYLTLVRTRPEVMDPVWLSRLTLAAAVAASEAVEQCTATRPLIKWVNDLYLGGRKVAGILTESVGWTGDRPEAVLIGIGINCSTVHFPEDIHETAGSLLAGTGGDTEDTLDRNRLAACVWERLSDLTDHLMDDCLLDEYRSRSLLTGKKVRFERNGLSYTGIAKDIDEHGRLLVELTSAIIPKSEDQLIALDSGEVHHTDW